MYSDAATSCSQIIEGAGGKGKDDFRWRSYDLLGTERKHRQVFAAEGSREGGREVRAVKETLQSIDDTLKRIEIILLGHVDSDLDSQSPLDTLQDAVAVSLSKKKASQKE